MAFIRFKADIVNCLLDAEYFPKEAENFAPS